MEPWVYFSPWLDNDDLSDSSVRLKCYKGLPFFVVKQSAFICFHSPDRAQRTAMAAITGRWQPSHTRQMDDLRLERLSARRTRICKTFAERTASNSRHMDMFTPVHSARRQGTYREIFARTGTCYKSAFPYLTRLLNQ